MPTKDYSAPGSKIVVADAGPAYETEDRGLVPQVVAYRVHVDSTSSPPIAEGASFIGQAGINKAEYLAAIAGLELVATRVATQAWPAQPVHLLSDNKLLIGQMRGEIGVVALRLYHERLTAIVEELEGRGVSVTYVHASDGERRSAHKLAKEFRTCCERKREWAAAKCQENFDRVGDWLTKHVDPELGDKVMHSLVGREEDSVVLLFPKAEPEYLECALENHDHIRKAMRQIVGEPVGVILGTFALSE